MRNLFNLHVFAYINFATHYVLRATDQQPWGVTCTCCSYAYTFLQVLWRATVGRIGWHVTYQIQLELYGAVGYLLPAWTALLGTAHHRRVVGLATCVSAVLAAVRRMHASPYASGRRWSRAVASVLSRSWRQHAHRSICIILHRLCPRARRYFHM